MAARYYCADSEKGDHVDDPSEDALFMLISDLNDSDNTFVVIQPDQDDPVWFASVASWTRADTRANAATPPNKALLGPV